MVLAREPYRDRKKEGTPHADVVMISERDTNEPANIICRSFGIGDYFFGYVIMWQNSRVVTTHEIGHLLGIPGNHNDHSMDEFSKNYKHQNCVMNWSAPSRYFCGHCLDRLIPFWEGLERTTGKKYFKN